jgi:hypothetical protein
MINSENPPISPEPPTPAAHVGPRATGAALIALIAALVVCGIWFAFYMVVFLPRAAP